VHRMRMGTACEHNPQSIRTSQNDDELPGPKNPVIVQQLAEQITSLTWRKALVVNGM